MFCYLLFIFFENKEKAPIPPATLEVGESSAQIVEL